MRESNNLNNGFPTRAIDVKYDFWQFVIIKFEGRLTSITSCVDSGRYVECNDVSLFGLFRCRAIASTDLVIARFDGK